MNDIISDIRDDLKRKNVGEEEIEAIQKKLDIPLPIEKLHPLFLAYSSEFEGKTEAPMEFIIPSFLVSICGAIGNRVCLPNGLYPIKSNLYLMIIGESTATKKTTSLNYGMDTLRKLSTERRKSFYLLNEAYQQAVVRREKGVPLPEKPIDNSFIYPDEVTPEQLLAKMVDKPDGVFCLSEIGAFLAKMDSGYSNGMKELLTILYDGKAPYLRETKSSGSYLVENASPSLVGASTFQWLQAHLKDADLLSGFLARFCYVVKRSPSPIDIPFQDPFQLPAIWRERFEEMSKMELELKLSPEAKESFSSYYSAFKKSIQEEDLFLHSPLGRLRDEICHKIAIINHILDLVEPNFSRFIKKKNIIEKRSYELAYPWIDFFAKNVRECYLELTQKLNFIEMKIIETIKKRGKESDGFKTLAKREIMKWSHLSLKDFTELIQTLIAKGQVSELKNGKYCFYRIKL